VTPLASALTRPYQFVRFYQFLINASIVTRWTLFIVPILAIIWIPGILALTVSPKGEVRPLCSTPRFRATYFLFVLDMGSAFDLVEHLVQCYVVW
jgi:hypothetical protein